MSLNRYAKRRDETERPIIDALRGTGHRVRQYDFPDLLVQNRSTGRLYLLEIDGVTKYRKRSKAQRDFIDEWRIPVVKTESEALRAVGEIL